MFVLMIDFACLAGLSRPFSDDGLVSHLFVVLLPHVQPNFSNPPPFPHKGPCVFMGGCVCVSHACVLVMDYVLGHFSIMQPHVQRPCLAFTEPF
jgi:hypothetical protein